MNSDQKLIKPEVHISFASDPHTDFNLDKTNSEVDFSYKLSNTKKGYRFKVFAPIIDGNELKVTYSYIITNAVINWHDIAELNYKIIGNGWKTELKHTKVTINFKKQNIPKLKVWAHGPSSGYTKVNRKKGQIILTANNVPGDMGVEVHTIFSPSATRLNKNIRHSNHQKTVFLQEKELLAQTKRAQKRKKILKQTISISLLVIGIIPCLFIFRKLFFSERIGTMPRRTSKSPHNYEIPDVDPVTAQVLDTGEYPNDKAFPAYLMYLAGKKRIAITKVENSNYKIELVDPTVKEKLRFIKEMFDIAGNEESFTTQDLRDSYLSHDSLNWKEEMYNQVINQGFFSKKLNATYNDIRFKSTLLNILLFILIPVSLFIIKADSYIPITITSLFLVNIVGRRIHKKRNCTYTKKGAKETEKVRGFKKMLADIGNFKAKNIGELIFWEDVMSYAVTFGLSKLVIKQLNIEFTKEELASVFPYNDGYSDTFDFNDVFSSSFDESLIQNSSDSDIGSVVPVLVTLVAFQAEILVASAMALEEEHFSTLTITNNDEKKKHQHSASFNIN